VFGTVLGMAARILVVEDDETIAGAIADRLRSEGFDVCVVGDGLVAVAEVERRAPALVVLDLMLPGLDGVEVCRRIHHRAPVIMLTARDDERDLLVGLAVGADDYLTKPFSMRELVARIRVVLRRIERPSLAAPISVGGLRVDEAQRRVHRDSDEVVLTPTEFDILICLLHHQGAVRTREQLLHEVWGYRDGSGARTVDSHVRALRRKVGDDVVRTVHGVGYAFGVPT
jgi:DNA-binding response OmpR family regulator